MDRAIPKIDQSKWTEIISVAKTPLALAVLVILVLSVALFYVPFKVTGTYRIVFTIGIIVFQLVLIIGIFIIAWFRPESLYGKRYLPQRQILELKDQIKGLVKKLEQQVNLKSQIWGIFQQADSFSFESILEMLALKNEDANSRRMVLAALGNLTDERKIEANNKEEGCFKRRILGG